MPSEVEATPDSSGATQCYVASVYIVAQSPISQLEFMAAIGLKLYGSSPAAAWKALLDRMPRVDRKEWKRRGHKAVKVSLTMTDNLSP